MPLCASLNSSPICEDEGCSNQEPLSVSGRVFFLSLSFYPSEHKEKFPMILGYPLVGGKVSGAFTPFGGCDTSERG